VEGGDHRLGKVGEWYVQVDTSKVVALSVSVKNRGVGIHEQVLNVPITCWCVWAQ
jgi:hypothetical protein